MFYIIFFLFATISLQADRIESLLAIGDGQQALIELAPLLAKDPDNTSLQRLEIRSFAKQTNIPALLKAYNRFCDLTPNDFDKDLLEDVAWAIINKASQSSSPIIRQEACIASFMTNDAKGMANCLKALNDRSEQMRLLATSLAARSRDEVLQQQTFTAIQNDSSPRVRLQSIAAVGAMRYDLAKDTLLAILEQRSATHEEKMAAITALTHITQEVDSNLIQTLTKSDRAPLRILACELVLNHFDKPAAEHLNTLMNDSVFDVRLAAIQCLATLGYKPPDDIINALTTHHDIKTKILAHWLSLVVGYKTDNAIQAFQNYLQLPDRELRLFAAGALSHAGPSIKHFSSSFMQSNDPLVRLNLAIGCIWQREDIQRTCRQLLSALSEPTRLSWQNIGIISFVGPSTASHAGGYARLPESQDLLLRLELYSMIASCDSCSIHEPLKALLKDKTWGISGQSACLMMQEGLIYFDELRSLLDDPCPEISLQAAFILAFYAQDDDALKVLTHSFNQASRQMKEYILYAVATIGTKSALPFLSQVLKEPFESLRVSAARGILICLYK